MELEILAIVVAAFLFAYAHHNQQVESFRSVQKSLVSIDASIAPTLALLQVAIYLYFLLPILHDLLSLGNINKPVHSSNKVNYLIF